MLPYTGDYIEYIEPGKNSLKFYSFTPRPLMRGDMYQMDDELAALLIDAHRNIGFLEGLVKYAPNKEVLSERQRRISVKNTASHFWIFQSKKVHLMYRWRLLRETRKKG